MAIITGGTGADTLTGNGGDTLRGLGGYDLYLVNGDTLNGTITIDDARATIMDRLRLVLAANLAPEFDGAKGATDTVLTVGGGQIILKNQAAPTSTRNGIEYFELSLGGTVYQANLVVGTNSAQNLHAANGVRGHETHAIVIGGGGNDTIFGDSDLINILSGGVGNDYLYGAQLDDVLYGGADNDVLQGNGGYDHLFGGDGDDTLTGGAEDDVFSGGAGNDLFYFFQGEDRVTDGNTGDRVFFRDYSVNLASFIQDGQDLVVSILNEGTARVVNWFAPGPGGQINAFLFGAFNAPTTLTAASVEDLLEPNLPGLEGNDTLFGDDGVNTIQGGLGNDRIFGGGGDDLLYGNAGNDELFGQDGHDRLFGGAGNDSLNGGAGADTLSGGTGDDVFVTDGLDTLTDSAGRDRVISYASFTLADGFEELLLLAGAANGVGNGGDNRIFGNAGANSLSGGGGNDSLFGNGGLDTLNGGLGDDAYFADADDVILDSGGYDKLRSAVNITLAAGIEELLLLDGAVSGVGNNLSNLIHGNAAANTLSGGAGAGSLSQNDELRGRDGDDLYLVDLGAFERIRTNDLGGASIDTLRATTPDLHRFRGSGYTLEQVDVSNVVTGQASVFNNQVASCRIEYLELVAPGQSFLAQWRKGDNSDMTAGDDAAFRFNSFGSYLSGGAGNDILGGAATMVGGTGDDLLIGSQFGSVVYQYASGDGADLVYGNAGQDNLLVHGVSQAQASFSRVGQDLRIGLGAPSDSVTVKGWYDNNVWRLDQITFSTGSSVLSAAQVEALV